MFAVSFRIKLLLAMMFLVVGVTAATLYVTQRKVQAAYRKLFQDQFETEVNYFTVQQEGRLKPLREHCLEFAKSGELREAILGGKPARIYTLATNELVRWNLPTLRLSRPFARANAGLPAAALLRRDLFLRVLDAQGQILPPPGPRGGPAQQAARRRLESQLGAVQESMDKLEEQQTGYLAPDVDTNTPQLREVIVTKVADPDTQKTLGALVLGITFLDAGGRAMNEMSGIQSGIWLDNQIHSALITNNAAREELSNLIAAEMKSAGRLRDTFSLNLAGAPQQVFFKLLNPKSPFPPAYQVSLYSLANSLNAQRELRLQILGLSALALLTALVLSLLFAHGFSTPLRELVAATAEIRAGNLRAKVPVRGRDELGELAASFNEMAEGLAQKELYRTVLNMVADEQVAHALVNGQLALGGELREISVLFCDIRGFTPLTENMPPEEVIEMLNEHMTALTRVVKEHNGVLDKFVGDLLMAIFGAPVSCESDTLNAARAALRLIRERERLNETSRHQLKIGISIATGKVVAGCMGSFDRLNYTVLGERVNLASRLCSQAAPGQVVIDQTTRERLGDSITATPLAALNLKGFTGQVVAYELTEVHSWELAEE